jgi:hypothetical protein
LSTLLKTIRDDKPAGSKENVKKYTEDQVEKNGVRRTKNKEIINKERGKKGSVYTSNFGRVECNSNNR